MKFLGVTLASLGLASAATVAKKVSYDDWKVFRVNVGSDAAKIDKMMSKLQLELWKGKPASSDVVDVMVPPSAVKDFETSTEDVETQLMHDNLGLSIAGEQDFSIYAGTFTPQSYNIRSANTNISRSGAKCVLVRLLPFHCRPHAMDRRPCSGVS